MPQIITKTSIILCFIIIFINKANAINKSVDKIRFSGDFRNRFEYIADGRQGRLYDIIRVRANMFMNPKEKLNLTFGISSGKGNPASTNLQISETFDYNPQINLATITYHFDNNLKLDAGKMKNPFYRPSRTQIMWDNDYNPKGLTLTQDKKKYSIKLAGISIDEGNSQTSTHLIAGQFLYKHKSSQTTKIISGIGYYGYLSLKNKQAVYNNKFKGNTDINGLYANNYKTLELFTELKTRISDRPLSVYGNYYKNIAVDEFGKAYSLGFLLNTIKHPGKWNLGIAYVDIDADAILATYNDSNFAGGNTDSKGIVFRSRMGIDKNIFLTMTYFNTIKQKQDISPIDYDRFQLDFTTRF